MAETEKITINLSAVDLGRIDLLVDEGFYSNRTDFIRSAIRSAIDRHATTLNSTVDRLKLTLGVMILDRSDLEEALAKNNPLSLDIIGVLSLSENIPPELARAAIKRLRVRGIFNASDAVRIALADVTE